MNIDDYILQHIDPEPEYLTRLNRETWIRMLNPIMCSGHLQGRVLSMLCKMIQPVHALELGTFTGYSALCIAESLPENGELDTIESDDELEEFILRNFEKTPFEDKINLLIGNALDIIPTLDKTYDLVFIDADKREYEAYYEAVLPKIRQGGFILADNTLWSGKVVEKVHQNDQQTLGILRFNELIATDNRVEKVILPLRDGLTLIRKK
ncbi:MAG TPA: O-methyltransferase [Paludibacteraceae bacterium]|jgi:predicted O-methyltransferase YrrM|nr:O-methyltransferase [Paludibacteraceae bacterium]HPS09912.1 O-methyltransferase [Paludibacteraceae bacterium]